MRSAVASLPPREQKVIALYYYGEVTMKEIGAEIGVNESRVSQLHARAIRRLRDQLGDMGPAEVAEMRQALIAFTKKPMAKAAPKVQTAAKQGVVLPYDPNKRRVVASRPALKVTRVRSHEDLPAVAAAR